MQSSDDLSIPVHFNQSLTIWEGSAEHAKVSPLVDNLLHERIRHGLLDELEGELDQVEHPDEELPDQWNLTKRRH